MRRLNGEIQILAPFPFSARVRYSGSSQVLFSIYSLFFFGKTGYGVAMTAALAQRTSANDVEFHGFVNRHRSQLETSGVPESTWPTLWNKLRDEIFDAGESFIFGRPGSEVRIR